MRSLLLIVTVLACAACDGPVCGFGTHEEAGECIANIQTRCAEGTVWQRGWCVVDDVVTPVDAETPDGASTDELPSSGGGEVRDGQDGS